MRIMISILLVMIMCGCGSKPLPINIYTTGNDSIFYSTDEKFDADKLIRGVQMDTAFFNKMLHALYGKKVFIKAFRGQKKDGIFTYMKLSFYLRSMEIPFIDSSKLNSEEEKYFDDITIWEKPTSPPEAVAIVAPTSVSEKIKPGEYHLLLLLKKDDTIWYRYDTTENEEGLKQIKPFTSAAIIKALDDVEKEYHLDLRQMEKNILVKGEINVGMASFKKLKQALKQKEIFRFRIVTTNDN